MILISDRSLEYKNRRLVNFYIEPDEDALETAFVFTSAFRQAAAIVYSPCGEHRLPGCMCERFEDFKEAIGGIRTTGIEIGESKGAGNVYFSVNTDENELECAGPIDFDFYSLIVGLGLNYKI